MPISGNIYELPFPSLLEEDKSRKSTSSRKESEKRSGGSAKEYNSIGTRTSRFTLIPQNKPRSGIVEGATATLDGSFSELKRCLEDQEQRRIDQIPAAIMIVHQHSDRSLISSLPFHDDNVGDDVPASPLLLHEKFRETEEPGTLSCPTKPERTPSSGGYTTISGSRASSRRFLRDGSEFRIARSDRTSNVAGRRHSDICARDVAANPNLRHCFQMEKTHSSPHLYRSRNQQAGPCFDMIRIAPEFSAPLRGSMAAKAAVSHNWYTTIACFGCRAAFFCIADVSYTICPYCRIISPVDEKFFQGEEMTHRWGLGLGFTDDDLFRLQMEVAMERSATTL